jgi:transposase
MEVLGFVTDDLREWRRLRAVALKRRGWVQRDIADALGASEVSVSRWLARAREHGPHALLARKAPGPSPKLPAAQVARIPEFLWHGPEAYGFRGRVWTRKRIARVIQEEFGVRYHPGHVGRLLAELHWTPQMPIRRASQRDESAIQWWRDVTWPDLRRQARRERRVLVFADEAGFYLLPGVVKTYAPEGRTPVLWAKLTRDHLSVMGGLTPAGKVYTLVRQEPLDGLDVVEFLAHLLRVAGKRLLVIWDGSPIHRRSEVKEFVEDSRGRVRVEALPGYAPDLNPWDEGGWHRLKDVEMRNLACRDLEELHEQFHLAIARLRRKPELVQAFFAQAGLKLSH